MTALRTCVCMFACLLGPTTYCKFHMWAHSNISQRSMKHVKACGVEAWLLECSIGDPKRRRLKFKHEWQLNSDLYFYWRRQAAHRRYKTMDGAGLTAGVASGGTVLINARNVAHNSCVKLCPCMCSHVSFPGWRNGWHLWYRPIVSEDLLVTYALSNLA